MLSKNNVLKNIKYISPGGPSPYDEAEVVSSSFPPLGECVVGARFLRLSVKQPDSHFFFTYRRPDLTKITHFYLLIHRSQPWAADPPAGKFSAHRFTTGRRVRPRKMAPVAPCGPGRRAGGLRTVCCLVVLVLRPVCVSRCVLQIKARLYKEGRGVWSLILSSGRFQQANS